ncbi:MAG: zinc-binding dehydrogenase [Polyangiales bacterium]
MKALVFELSVPRYLAAKALGQRFKGLHWGPGSCFDLREVPAPTPPSRDFARLAPTHVGLCGSDLAAILFKSSTSLSAYASFPAVFGHEVLARVFEPPAGSDLRAGDRVVVDPFLSCEARGATDCRRCAEGAYATCERAGVGPRKGMMLGACADLPGGFSESMVAHRGQLFRVPASVPDEVAVLTEPLTVAAHAVLKNPPRDGASVLVIGGGVIALAAVWALAEFFPACRVTLLAMEPYQLELGLALGAAKGILRGKGEVLTELGADAGSGLLRPVMGRPFLASGYDQVIDCVGSRDSLDDALRSTRAGGRLVLLGCAGELPKVDWTFVWSREVTIAGSLAYGWVDDPRAEEKARRRSLT